jgi:hypothetical protein
MLFFGKNSWKEFQQGEELIHLGQVSSTRNIALPRSNITELKEQKQKEIDASSALLGLSKPNYNGFFSQFL